MVWSLRRELRATLALAGPVVAAEIGWMAMGVVDTIMVGRLGPAAIGAVGVGSGLFLVLAVFGMGLLLGLDTVVSQAYGARRFDECHRALYHGLALGVTLTPLAMSLGWAGTATLPRWGFDPTVLPLLRQYLDVLVWSAGPLFLYAALRRYLQAMDAPHPVMVALVSANGVKALANWVLIDGRLGAPALGVSGAAWATVIARAWMAAVLLVAVLRHARRHRTGLGLMPAAIELARLRRLLRLGLPAATQALLEYGVFAGATALAGRLDPVALAAHQIVLNLSGLTFMVPLGLASAGAVRVGHAVGRADPHGAARAGWTAVSLGVCFMTAAAALFLLAPSRLLAVFTTDSAVVRIGVELLAIAALFQIFDGLQGVLTGTLRGLGDTRTPMLFNLAGHWMLGLPLGYTLCFSRGWGVRGLWVGLSTGLVVVGGVLLAVWSRAVRRLCREEPGLARLSAALEPSRSTGAPSSDRVANRTRRA